MVRALWLLAASAIGISLGAHAAPFAAVSLRPYQAHGPSYLRLFLYSLDGKLMRELPEKPGLDDEQPAISPDGSRMIFFRHAADAAHRPGEQFVKYDIASGRETPIDPGFVQTEQRRFLPTVQVTEFSLQDEKAWRPDADDGEDAESFASPDGGFQIVRRPNAAYSDAGANDEPQFHYYLKAKGAAQLRDLAALPAYKPYGTPWGFLALNGTPFFRQQDRDALFMIQHIGSTDGDAIWVLDLKAQRWIEMSRNGGHLYSIEDQPGVTLVRDSRYEDLGKTGLSVNCGYLEFWGANLKPVDFGPPVSLFHNAAIFYGDGKTAIIGDPQFGS